MTTRHYGLFIRAGLVAVALGVGAVAFGIFLATVDSPS